MIFISAVKRSNTPNLGTPVEAHGCLGERVPSADAVLFLGGSTWSKIEARDGYSAEVGIRFVCDRCSDPAVF